MSHFRIDTLASLARQMKFTPHLALASQLAAAETLLHELDPGKAYPPDFVVFRVTGFHPRDIEAPLLAGLALQHDLGLLIEILSDQLNLAAAEASEPVLSIDDVTERFNVTSKTIQRWRRRGLPARKFIFADGKRRVGFFLSSVERFIIAQGEPVVANVSKVNVDERDRIVLHARRLAKMSGCPMDEITRRIARRLGRSPLTILHTIRRHDQESPADPIECFAPQPVSEEIRGKIIRARRKGATVRAIARQQQCSSASVFRVLRDERIARLTQRKIKFIDDSIYADSDAATIIRAILLQDELPAAQTRDELRVPRDLPPYLQELYRTPLLTASRERGLFLQFNFQKYLFAQARAKLDPQLARSRDVSLLESLLRDAVETKNAIVRANLRLVVSVARKHLRANLNLMELISDGNLTLMRAVEGFDIHRGNRFSTYATLALMKGFARSVPMMHAAGRRTQSVDLLPGELTDAKVDAPPHRIAEREELGALLAKLDDRERLVLRAHYGLNHAAPSSYEDVAAEIGISTQRVRQIEQAALSKLRAISRG